ncbi:MAG TPA: gephyrin-like molybdotransferase Glp [Pyrinomonadaceae bacterium]
MISVSQALRIVKRETGTLPSETVILSRALGRVLAENIAADSDMPPFDRSQMDGYAVRSNDVKNAPVLLTIVGEAAAGRGWHEKLKPGQAVRIMTGAPVPSGADSVQKIELASESNETVRIQEPVQRGKYIVKKGAEIRKGTILFRSGQIVDEKMIASLAAFGYARVKVGQRPSVSILSTGSEIVGIEKQPGRDQIRNSNSVMLKALCEHAGASVKILRQTGDDLEKLKGVISKAARHGGEKSKIQTPKSKILIMTGGVSVGKYDLTKAALKDLGAEFFFEKLRLKPGKPTVFARLDNSLVFGLPGNPVSAAVTFYLFVRTAILQMQNASETGLPSGHAVLESPAKAAAERDTYLPATLATDSEGKLVATPLRWHGSSDFVGFANADALVSLARGSASKAGDVVKILYL